MNSSRALHRVRRQKLGAKTEHRHPENNTSIILLKVQDRPTRESISTSTCPTKASLSQLHGITRQQLYACKLFMALLKNKKEGKATAFCILLRFVFCSWDREGYPISGIFTYQSLNPTLTKFKVHLF